MVTKASDALREKNSQPSQTRSSGLSNFRSFERTVSILGRSQSTFNNYSACCGYLFILVKIPTELDAEQVQDYLFISKKKSKTPSTNVF
jgi:hypothetical protein